MKTSGALPITRSRPIESQQILQLEQKFVKNPNWWEADKLSIYKAWRSWIRDHRRQIHLVAGNRIWTRDVRITNPAPWQTAAWIYNLSRSILADLGFVGLMEKHLHFSSWLVLSLTARDLLPSILCFLEEQEVRANISIVESSFVHCTQHVQVDKYDFPALTENVWSVLTKTGLIYKNSSWVSVSRCSLSVRSESAGFTLSFSIFVLLMFNYQA